jgi:hypothetical protein
MARRLEARFFEPSALDDAGGRWREGGLRAASRLAHGQWTEKRDCWDRVLVGNQGDRYCSDVDSPAAAAGWVGAALVSWAAQPWVWGLPAWREPLQPAAEVPGDHRGLSWRCPWCRQRRRGRGVSGLCWEVWTSWCSSVDRGQSQPQGRGWGQAAW